MLHWLQERAEVDPACGPLIVGAFFLITVLVVFGEEPPPHLLARLPQVPSNGWSLRYPMDQHNVLRCCQPQVKDRTHSVVPQNAHDREYGGIFCAAPLAGRLYLGMHSPVDLAAGLIVGLALTGVWCSLDVAVVNFLRHGQSGEAQPRGTPPKHL